MTITQADVAAARAFLDNMNFDTSSERQVAIYAQAAADQRQAEIASFIRAHADAIASAKGYYDPKAMREIADAIESGTWRTE